ncbi:dTDP-4-amino-4,6-dideoxygalactose transaminase [Dongia soli]|uniref:dTDP-4-amino-4,6-dideoxygalactose transaminase n=1 Tax=Dongia soli TaxID=600628 RepID=A0ABU5EE08_9PROT|nr:dTDP-4-amino-4,6-dideoxygalactose transaminase [Dongia soli]MDY0884064.1 dTDP-4-amino-4,6-dideoxygalactose transaminase [Dongia soli]
MAIRFNKPFLVGKELENLRHSLEGLHLSGDGPFSEKCHKWLERHYGCTALLTHSCTAALEMAAILANIGPGDEVIMPSYTFVSTANAFVLRGARPVFVDIRPDTLNIDERLLEQALSARTKAIAAVHYAGIGCDMESILAFAAQRGLTVIEDAAQAYLCTYKGRPLGRLGATGALSFHETKNVVSGEGGALLINDETLVERAHIIREKGTNRTQFLRREVAKYEWLDIGSSYLPSDLIAAVLLAQLEEAEAIIAKRRLAWQHYHEALAPLENEGLLRRPTVPADCQHNGHIYYIILRDVEITQNLLRDLRNQGIGATTHYIPLHSAPAGLRYGRVAGSMEITDHVGTCLVRLPLHAAISKEEINRVAEAVTAQLSDKRSKRS